MFKIHIKQQDKHPELYVGQVFVLRSEVESKVIHPTNYLISDWDAIDEKFTIRIVSNTMVEGMSKSTYTYHFLVGNFQRGDWVRLAPISKLI